MNDSGDQDDSFERLLRQAAHVPERTPAGPGTSPPMAEGTVVAGRYRLGRQIGKGGMGRVFEAVQLGLDRPVALKMLWREWAQSRPEARLRFEKEARLAAAIGHENIVQVIEVGCTEEDEPFIVMERLQGQSLRERIDAGPVGADEALGIGDQVLAALEAAHQRGIIHRDIKAENVFVSEGGRVKVLDFGISKQLTEEGPTAALTQTGALLGTPLYLTPEQAAGRGAVDARVDLYATAVLLYHALSGRYPHEADNQRALLLAIATRPPTPLHEVAPRVAPSLQALVMKGLHADPAHRFQRATEMRQTLGAVLRGLGAEDLAMSSPGLPGGRRWSLAVPLLAAATLLAGGLGWTLLGSTPPAPASPIGPPALTAVPPLPTPLAPSPFPAPAEVAAAPQDAGAPPEPAEIAVRIRVEPTTARLQIDGRPVQNPLETRLPRHAGAWLVLSASAPGFVTQTVRHPHDRDLELQVSLERERRARPAPSRAPDRLRLRQAVD